MKVLLKDELNIILRIEHLSIMNTFGYFIVFNNCLISKNGDSLTIDQINRDNLTNFNFKNEYNALYKCGELLDKNILKIDDSIFNHNFNKDFNFKNKDELIKGYKFKKDYDLNLKKFKGFLQNNNINYRDKIDQWNNELPAIALTFPYFDYENIREVDFFGKDNEPFSLSISTKGSDDKNKKVEITITLKNYFKNITCNETDFYIILDRILTVKDKLKELSNQCASS